MQTADPRAAQLTHYITGLSINEKHLLMTRETTPVDLILGSTSPNG